MLRFVLRRATDDVCDLREGLSSVTVSLSDESHKLILSFWDTVDEYEWVLSVMDCLRGIR